MYCLGLNVQRLWLMWDGHINGHGAGCGVLLLLDSHAQWYSKGQRSIVVQYPAVHTSATCTAAHTVTTIVCICAQFFALLPLHLAPAGWHCVRCGHRGHGRTHVWHTTPHQAPHGQPGARVVELLGAWLLRACGVSVHGLFEWDVQLCLCTSFRQLSHLLIFDGCTVGQQPPVHRFVCFSGALVTCSRSLYNLPAHLIRMRPAVAAAATAAAPSPQSSNQNPTEFDLPKALAGLGLTQVGG